MPEGATRTPEVWRSPVFNPKTTRPAPPPRHDNRQLVEDIAACGWLQPGLLTLDATWGGGVWWKKWRPDRLVAMDAFAQKAPPPVREGERERWVPPFVQADFRRPPFPSASFDQIAYDPPYKLNGTDQGEGERYGVDVKATWQERFQLMLDGLAWWPPCWRCHGLGILQPDHDESATEVLARALVKTNPGAEDHEDTAVQLLAALAGAGLYLDASRPCPVCEGSGRGGCEGLAPLLRPGGIIVVKCMDQVVSQAVRWQTTELQRRGEAAGLILVDRFDLPGTPRPQDESRGQDHARQNVSAALVFQRPRGRKRPITWTA